VVIFPSVIRVFRLNAASIRPQNPKNKNSSQILRAELFIGYLEIGIEFLFSNVYNNIQNKEEIK
jgi:hypothetical protein